MLGIFVINAGASAEQISAHVRRQAPVETKTKGCLVRFVGNAVAVFNQPIGHEFESPARHSFLCGSLIPLRLILVTQRRYGSNQKTVSGGKKQFFPVPPLPVFRGYRQFVEGLLVKLDYRPLASKNVSGAFAEVKGLELKGRFCGSGNRGIFDLHHYPRPFSVDKRSSIRQSSLSADFRHVSST